MIQLNRDSHLFVLLSRYEHQVKVCAHFFDEITEVEFFGQPSRKYLEAKQKSYESGIQF